MSDLIPLCSCNCISPAGISSRLLLTFSSLFSPIFPLSVLPLSSLLKIQWLRRAGYPQNVIQEIITEQENYEKQQMDIETNGYYDEETGEWVPAAPGEVYDDWGNLTCKDGVKQGYYDEATGEWIRDVPGEVYDEWGTLIVKDGVEQGYYDEETGEWIQTAEYDEKGKLIEYDEYGNIIVKEEPAPATESMPEVPAQQDVEVVIPDEPFEDDEEESVPDVVMAEPQPAAAISPPQPSPVDAKKKEQQGSARQSEDASKMHQSLVLWSRLFVVYKKCCPLVRSCRFYLRRSR